MEAVALVFFSAVVPIEVVYAKESLGVSDTGYGVLLGSWGVGMLFGSLVFARLRRASLPLLLLCSTLAIAAGYLGMAAAPTLAVACVASDARRNRQRRAVGRDGQRGAGADHAPRCRRG